MPALVVDFQAEIDYVFFAHLNVIRNSLATHHLSPTTLIETELRFDQLALVFDQPLNTVVWAASLFVGSKRYDDVPVRPESFAFVADEVGDPDGCLRFVVTGAAAIEIAIFLDELKRIHA